MLRIVPQCILERCSFLQKKNHIASGSYKQYSRYLLQKKHRISPDEGYPAAITMMHSKKTEGKPFPRESRIPESHSRAGKREVDHRNTGRTTVSSYKA